MHALPVGAGHGGRAGRARRSATAPASTASSCAEGTTGAGHRRAPGRRRGGRRRRRRRQPRPARRLPHAAARAPDAAGGPSRPLLAVGPRVARRRPRRRCPPGTEHHNIHFGARLGRRLPGDPPRRRAHARPVAPRERPVAARADDGARRAPTPSTCSSPRPTSTAASTGPTSAAEARDDLLPPPRAARLPDRHRGRGARRPARLGARRGWSGAPRSRSRTGSSRPVRSGPATSSGGRPAWCSPAPARCPASACRWCWCPGMLAAQRVEELAAR